MRTKEWFDDDEFWTVLYPFMFPERRFTEAEDLCESLLALAGSKGRRVLDLCCGPGRFSVALARRGFQVTGVDRTAFLLEKAKAATENAGVEVEYVTSDMRDFVRPDSFDLALNLFTSFGYFDEKDEDLTVLANIQRSLSPGGKLLLDVMGKERLARCFVDTTSNELEDGSLLIQRHEIFDDWKRIRNDWILIRETDLKRFRFHHSLYSGQELRALMMKAGFADVKLYGGFDGSPYDLYCKTLIAVATK